jgi:hypothetical protein
LAIRTSALRLCNRATRSARPIRLLSAPCLGPPASTLTVARAREQASTRPTTSLPSWNATSRRLVAGETAGSSPTQPRNRDCRLPSKGVTPTKPTSQRGSTTATDSRALMARREATGRRRYPTLSATKRLAEMAAFRRIRPLRGSGTSPVSDVSGWLPRDVRTIQPPEAGTGRGDHGRSEHPPKIGWWPRLTCRERPAGNRWTTTGLYRRST